MDLLLAYWTSQLIRNKRKKEWATIEVLSRPQLAMFKEIKLQEY